jgi:hypothetical protein
MKSPDRQTLGGSAAEQIRALRHHVLGLSSKMPAGRMPSALESGGGE